MIRRAIYLIALNAMLPLMMFGASASRVEPTKASSTELFGRYMLNTGDISSALPISIEAKAEDVTLEKVLLAADAAKTSAIPSKLFLDQNYPNPFNPSTMIRYGLPVQSNVKITVHTLLGNQLKVALDGVQDAGTYTFDFSAEDLPSGIYFYRLQTDMGTLTRRMTISK
jgi:hypothetical protein